MNKIKHIYDILYKEYGPQGWWPLSELNNKEDVSITKSGSLKGYHPKDYTYPKTENQIFEICIGAILTQNTNWLSVEKAIQNLKRMNALSLKGIKKLSDGKLREAIKPAGYYNQKAKKLKIFFEYFKNLREDIPKRDDLLNIWGIGSETADSILLYAYKKPHFVVDSYTKRIFERIGLLKKKTEYDDIKKLFEENLSKDIIIFMEYHALIVEHAKRYCQKKPLCEKCPIAAICQKI